MTRLALPLCCLLVLLSACGSLGGRQTVSADTPAVQRPPGSERGNDVVIYALGLIDTGYRYGGKNPKAGLDCSGMVSHIYGEALGVKVSGSAADIARQTRSIPRDALRPGDLVFFNTRNKPYSHVGIYIGEQRFVHAPSTNGKVRIDHLSNQYYAQRYEAAASLLD